MSSPEPLIITDRELLDPGTEFFTDWKMFKKDDEGYPIPAFTVNEVAKFFFGKTPDWMRWRIRNRFFAGLPEEDCPHGVLVPTGAIKRSGAPVMEMDWWFKKRTDDGTWEDGSREDDAFFYGRAYCSRCKVVDYADHYRAQKGGARVYALSDVEQMAHALAQGGHIDGSTLASVIILVKTNARVYGYL